jgi:hypothetical protein
MARTGLRFDTQQALIFSNLILRARLRFGKNARGILWTDRLITIGSADELFKRGKSGPSRALRRRD